MSSRLRPASLVTASSRNLGACKGRSKKQDREWAELSRMWAQGNSVSLSSVGRGALDHNPALELSLLEARSSGAGTPVSVSHWFQATSRTGGLAGGGW